MSGSRFKLPSGRAHRPQFAVTGTGSVEVMDEAESEFVAAMAEFQRVNKVRFPSWTQALWVARQLGYAKVTHHEHDD